MQPYHDDNDDANDNDDDYDDIDSNDNDDKNDDDDDDSTQAERTCNPALWESSLTHRLLEIFMISIMMMIVLIICNQLNFQLNTCATPDQSTRTECTEVSNPPRS